MTTKNLLASIAFVLIVAVGFFAGVGSIENGKEHGWMFVVLGLANFVVAGLAAFKTWELLKSKED